jgi:hypothetical protein
MLPRQRVSVCIGEAAGAADRAAVRIAVVADGGGKGCPDVGVRVLWEASLLLQGGVGIPARSEVRTSSGLLRLQTGYVRLHTMGLRAAYVKTHNRKNRQHHQRSKPMNVERLVVLARAQWCLGNPNRSLP